MSVERLLKETFGSWKDEEYYPGSRQRRRESKEARQARLTSERIEAKANESWDARPWRKRVKLKDGREAYLELFPIGALAKALHRDSVTVRAWIRKGWLPHAGFQTKPLAGTRGDAGRRLWTHAQIEGIARIAEEEGLLSDNPPRIQRTRFTEKVMSAWKEWL
jgi:hypothetical protein